MKHTWIGNSRWRSARAARSGPMVGLVAAGVALALLAVPSEARAVCVDNDGDGWDSCWDCDDNDATKYPGASEKNCDGIDNDCDGKTDESYKAPWTECGTGACFWWGKMRCIDGELVDDCVPNPPTGPDDNCNLIDEDCDGLTDEDFVPGPVTCGTGPCEATGFQQCVNGKLKSDCQPGSPIGTDNTCNNIDDDCDGDTDEGYNATWVSCGEGECLNWVKPSCVDGVSIVDCQPLPGAPDDSSCNNQDDDCDGLTDEDAAPLPTTCGIGFCETQGEKVCSKGKYIDQCQPLKAPGTDDNCDGIDNDCDGKTDEAYKASWTECGLGGCFSWGKLACVNGELIDNCEPQEPAALDDVTCDNKDDDCDGETDEDVVATPTECGIGTCASTGALECIKGDWKDTCEPLLPTEQDNNCDGIDQDCDGQTDEHFQGEMTSCGQGACQTSKRDKCVNGQVTVMCVPVEPSAQDDHTCNNWDDDCDGETDEDFAGPALTCGEGACAAVGKTLCVDGKKVEECTPHQPDNLDDNCDGVDDNCNGIADEDYVAVEISCGVGACANVGETECVGGQIIEVCQEKQGGADDATCDGVDDDCDGVADEDFGTEQIECGDGACVVPGVATCVDGQIQDTCEGTENGTGAAVEEICDGFDNDCDGTIDEDAVGVYYTATQGGFNVPVREYKGNTDVATFYNYEQLYDFSSYTGFERPDRTTVIFHRAPNSALSLVVIHDSPLGNSGGVAMLKIEGLEKGTIVTQDDPAGGIDSYNINSGIFYWNWANGTTDGVAIENVGSDVCVTLTGVVANGTNGFDLAWGTSDAQRAQLGALNKPLKICATTCCVPAATDECDGIDNDCDGEIDEDAVGESIQCGVGGCGVQGERVCSDGVWVDQCSPGAPAADDATCDGVDDDCDGESDEDYVQGQSVGCGQGVCAAEGSATCVDGAEQVDCTPFPPVEGSDVCDGLDTDCDGAVDEDFAPETVLCGIGACERPSKTTCDDGIISDFCEEGAPLSDSDATCDGVDDDCDGQVDEDFVDGSPIECGVGACTNVGTAVCSEGVLIQDCEPLTAPEGMVDDCDGIDNDCDGQVDEDFVTTPTECGDGACAATGEMACEQGLVVNTCEEGTPAADDSLCNGLDDDCDGAVDEDFVSQSTQCGSGVCAAVGTSSCEGGVLLDSCQAGPALSATDDTCDGLDEDCDGTADDDYVGEFTTCGQGACGAVGQYQCVDGQEVDSCQEGTAAADDKVCNGLDDDCDGEVDEDAVPQTISCGNGPCTASGTRTCAGGVEVDECTPVDVAAADDATCDNVDDDCDGEVDEDFPVEPTTCAAGVCIGKGQIECQQGEPVDTCVPPEQQPSDTACDGIDEDCDGQTDEDYLPQEVTCGNGPCEVTGLTACIDGAEAELCTPIEPEVTEDLVCDGVDEDCDGSVDEDYVVTTTSCGLGVCAAEGELTCNDGSEVDSCQEGEPLSDVDLTCDTIDEDCDGTADDDFVEEAIICGKGECAAPGKLACTDGVIAEQCEQGAEPSEEVCDRLDNDCDGYVDNGFAPPLEEGELPPAPKFTANQGIESHYVPVYEGTVPSPEFYAYNSETSSSESGLASPNRSTFMLYREPAGALSLVIVNDAENDGSGGHLIINVDGFTQGTIGVGDDPENEQDIFDVEGGYFEWHWNECCTDGVVVHGVGNTLCITVAVESVEGIEGFDIAWGTGPDQRFQLVGGMEQPFTICQSMCTEEPPPLDCWSQGLDPSTTPDSVCQPVNCPEPWAEIDDNCDGIDDDCDGTPDDDFQAPPVVCGVGACVNFGESKCESGVIVDKCEEAGPIAEICDGLDNDCDGGVDEDLESTATECGMGPCAAVGLKSCTGGQWVDTCEPLPASSETDATCDAVDDDCDGSVDEDYVPASEKCGVGACEATGDTLCVAGTLQPTCEPGSPSEEVCDGIDNDCDASVDEDLEDVPTTCGQGACAANGEMYCEFGAPVDSCQPGVPAIDDSTCDGVDSDCDGTVDEDWVPPADVCNGDPEFVQCVDGVVIAECEECDGKDNNGNGQVDEGTSGVFYEVTQGGVSFGVLPVKAGVDVSTFYGYHTTQKWSSSTGFEASDRGTFMLYEDPNGTMSLVVLLDDVNDGSGGAARMRIEGLEQGEVSVFDDKGGADSYNLDKGRLQWKWNSCCTDGAAISNIGDNFCVTVEFDKSKGLGGLDFVSGAGGEERLSLPAINEPFTICRVTCCTPTEGGEVCDGIDNDCDGEVDEGLTASTLHIAQGDFTTEVTTYQTGQSVTDWYSYGNPDNASANTGLELPDTMVLTVHEDAEGNKALVLIADAARDGDGGKMVLHIDGMTGAEDVFMDDPKSSADKLNLSAGTIQWTWYSCCTDGAVLGKLPDDFCFTMRPSVHKGITAFAYVDGDGTVYELPVPTEQDPLTICSVPYCLEPGD